MVWVHGMLCVGPWYAVCVQGLHLQCKVHCATRKSGKLSLDRYAACIDPYPTYYPYNMPQYVYGRLHVCTTPACVHHAQRVAHVVCWLAPRQVCQASLRAYGRSGKHVLCAPSHPCRSAKHHCWCPDKRCTLHRPRPVVQPYLPYRSLCMERTDDL